LKKSRKVLPPKNRRSALDLGGFSEKKKELSQGPGGGDGEFGIAEGEKRRGSWSWEL